MNVAAQDLSIRQLQYVVAVAETLGFHRAAERCRVSQPTLSSQVGKLEEVLGVRIFERDRRHVLVTTAGAAVVNHAKKILMGVDDLLAVANESAADPFATTFRVGVIPTIAPYLLPWVTPAVKERWPKLRLALVEQKTDDVLASLRAGTLEAGLLALVDGMDDTEHAIVAVDPFVAALPSTHPLAKKKSVTVSELEEESVLLLEDGHCLRTQALSLCKRAGSKETDLRATSLATLVQMVSAGAGVTLLPSIAVDVENRRGQLAIRPITSNAPKNEQGRTIVLAWRKAAPQAAALREIARVMAQAASEMAKPKLR
jgi:LysR family transcriptional regulator, hydrogen peroxide-inducible genes activator